MAGLLLASVLSDPVLGQDDEPKSRFNLKLKTLGGQQFWTDLLIISNWKIQRNEMTEHCRLIDSNNYRHAWGNYEQCYAELGRQSNSGKIKPYEGEVVIFLYYSFE